MRFWKWNEVRHPEGWSGCPYCGAWSEDSVNNAHMTSCLKRPNKQEKQLDEIIGLLQRIYERLTGSYRL